MNDIAIMQEYIHNILYDIDTGLHCHRKLLLCSQQGGINIGWFVMS